MATKKDLYSIQLAKVRQKIAEREAILDTIPPGVDSVTVDGTTTRWDRKALLAEIKDLKKEAAALRGRKETVANIRLDGAF